MLVLWPIELLIMYFMSRKNREKNGAAAWVQEDTSSVDMTPWKYRKVASVAILLFVAVVYITFSPLGIGAWGSPGS